MIEKFRTFLKNNPRMETAYHFLRGGVDYTMNPSLFVPYEMGFNGQKNRQQIFDALVRTLGTTAIVETGTFRGVTTEWMARQKKIPIYTIEKHPRYFGFAFFRLWKYPKVRMSLGDSVDVLREKIIPKIPADQPVLFYLDAHWEDFLPLNDELRIIFGHFQRAVVLIDDFRVPDFPGYGYDDYGPSKALTIEYIRKADTPKQYIFFPSTPPEEETGSKRGCVVVVCDRLLANQLEGLDLLRGYA